MIDQCREAFVIQPYEGEIQMLMNETFCTNGTLSRCTFSMLLIALMSLAFSNAYADEGRIQCDIKPGSDPNSINTKSCKGVIPVAIFGDGPSNCLEAHGGLGCDDAVCQAEICDSDSSCCDTAWDSVCAAAAEECDVPEFDWDVTTIDPASLNFGFSRLVVIDPDGGAGSNCTDTLEPGVTAFRVDGDMVCDFVLQTTNLEFSCDTCANADFTDAVTRIGGQTSFCGYANGIPRQIISNDDQICARSTLNGNKWDIDFLSHDSFGAGCEDNDGGTSCAAAGGFTSYNRTGHQVRFECCDDVRTIGGKP